MAAELKPRDVYLAGISEIRPASADRPSASRIYRLPIAKDAFPTSEWSTLHELFQKSVAKHSKEPLLGWRPFDEAGKVQPYVWITYEETAERVKEVASGLAALGLTAGSRVGVYGVNCPEWMLAMQVRVVPPALLDLGFSYAPTASAAAAVPDPGP
jgi:long-chain acyl-CoA synthetase